MTALLAVLLTALLTAASFPPFDLGVLALVALLPLLMVTGRGSTARRDLLLGWLAGWCGSTAVVWWVINTIVHYGGLSPILAVPILLLMTWGMGFFWGVFSWARGLVLRRRPGVPELLFTPALWVALEFARAHLPELAFPWALLGYTQYLHLPLIQHADLFGVWAVSWMVVAVNAALAGLAAGGGRTGRPAARAVPILAVAALGVLAWRYGSWRLQKVESGDPLRVAVVQGNIEQDVKWDPAYKRSTFDLYSSLTSQAVRAGARVVVWPETAAPFFYEQEPGYRREISDMASSNSAAILFGSPAVTGGGPERSLRNRAYLVDGKGRLRGWYDKLHLVPFGEYVPWKRWLFFVDKLVQAVGEFSPGEGPAVLEAEGARLGPLICYEVIFPELARKLVGQGASVLVNITNDAWFGRTAASRQHFSTLVFRAVENRRPVARAANTGISGFVDSRGRILEASELFVRGVYLEELYPSEESTLYSRMGDVFPALCGLAAAAALVAALPAGKRAERRRLRLPG